MIRDKFPGKPEWALPLSERNAPETLTDALLETTDDAEDWANSATRPYYDNQIPLCDICEWETYIIACKAAE